MTPEDLNSMREAAYRAYPAINYSTLKVMRDSPKHYRAALEAPPKPPGGDPKFSMFSAVHTLVLEPFQFDAEYAVYDGRRDKRTKAYQAFLADNEGKTILTPDELEQAKAISDAVLEHPWVAELLQAPGTKTEQVSVWEDSDAGPCKAKMDWTHYSRERGLLSVDLKSFASTEADFIGRQGARYGWPLQHAHYLHAGAAFWGVNLAEVPYRALNVVVEAGEPHDVIVVEWRDTTLDAAFAQHRRLLQQVAECQESGVWPGRHHNQWAPVPVDAPDYLLY